MPTLEELLRELTPDSELTGKLKALSLEQLKAVAGAMDVEGEDLVTAIGQAIWRKGFNEMACGRPTGVTAENCLRDAMSSAELGPDERIPNCDEKVVVFVEMTAKPNDIDKTIEGLNRILSGPPSPPEIRRFWPRPFGASEAALNRPDPVVTAKFIPKNNNVALVLAFDSAEDSAIYCHKLNYQIFANEGAAIINTQNLADYRNYSPFNFRIPTTLIYFLRYVLNGTFVFHDGWTLRGDDNIGRYEPGLGHREPLSNWMRRTVARLAGTIPAYPTADPSAF